MSPEFVAVAMFCVLFLALFSGHPLAFSLGGVAVLFGLIGWGGSPDQVFSLFTNKTYGVMDEYVLVAVPLFIFMAQMLDVAGIAEALFNTMHVLWGPVARRPRDSRPYGLRGVRGVNRRRRARPKWP